MMEDVSAEIHECRVKLASLDEAYASVHDTYVRKRREIVRELRDLTRRAEPRLAKPKRFAKDLDPHQQAGADNLRTLRRLIRITPGPFTQSWLHKQVGINSGTMVWCIRALEAEGLLERTGQRIARSPEFMRTRADRVTTSHPGT
jgi:hypothetical protein